MMIQRPLILLLLVVTLVPAVVSGRPVYHCLVTGAESFLCACAPNEPTDEEASCCSRCARADADAVAAIPAESPRVRRGGPSLCDCCEVSILHLVTVLPRDDEPRAGPVPTLAFDALPLDADRVSLAREGGAIRDRAPPGPVRGPVPLEHPVLRL